jgi:hypothetical protein
MTIDYCLKNADKAEFDTVMLATGLCVEVTEGEGKEAVTTIVPASYEVLIDRIGPITIDDKTYPEYYTNLRLLFEPTEDQVAALTPFVIDPNSPHYRVWA